MGTKVLKCKCNHSYQDGRYGKHMRVMNETTKISGKKRFYRCTVCKAEKLS